MSDGKTPRDRAEKLTREERLAAKLRENLRRRKAQARAVATGPETDADGESPADKPPLAKSSPES